MVLFNVAGNRWLIKCQYYVFIILYLVIYFEYILLNCVKVPDDGGKGTTVANSVRHAVDGVRTFRWYLHGSSQPTVTVCQMSVQTWSRIHVNKQKISNGRNPEIQALDSKDSRKGSDER